MVSSSIHHVIVWYRKVLILGSLWPSFNCIYIFCSSTKDLCIVKKAREWIIKKEFKNILFRVDRFMYYVDC